MRNNQIEIDFGAGVLRRRVRSRARGGRRGAPAKKLAAANKNGPGAGAEPPREDSGPRNLLPFNYSAYAVGPGGGINTYFAFDITLIKPKQHRERLSLQAAGEIRSLLTETSSNYND